MKNAPNAPIAVSIPITVPNSGTNGTLTSPAFNSKQENEYLFVTVQCFLHLNHLFLQLQ